MSQRRPKAGWEYAAPVFAALGDKTRLRLITRLSREGPASITNLASGARITRQAITKHLHVLAGAGLVRGSRHGREQLWELNARRLEQARHHLDLISRQWDQVLDRLKLSVEDQQD